MIGFADSSCLLYFSCRDGLAFSTTPSSPMYTVSMRDNAIGSLQNPTLTAALRKDYSFDISSLAANDMGEGGAKNFVSGIGGGRR